MYRLSKFIPVPMRSTYWNGTAEGPQGHHRATWWQWRGHIWAHRVTSV